MGRRRLEVHSLLVDFRVAVVTGDAPVDQWRRSSDASFVHLLRLLLWAALTSSWRSTAGEEGWFLVGSPQDMTCQLLCSRRLSTGQRLDSYFWLKGFLSSF